VIIMTETKLGEGVHASSEFMPPGYSPPIGRIEKPAGKVFLLVYVIATLPPR